MLLSLYSKDHLFHLGILTGGIYLDLRSFIFFLVKLSQYAVSAENISKGRDKLVKKVFAVFSGDCMTVEIVFCCYNCLDLP